MVKKSKTPTPSEPNPGHPGLRAGRWGRVDRALRLSTLGCAMAVKALALIWELAQMVFLPYGVAGVLSRCGAESSSLAWRLTLRVALGLVNCCATITVKRLERLEYVW